MINEQGAHTMAELIDPPDRRGSGSRESRHPLNHLIMQLMLFGTWDAFLEQYQRDFITLPSTKDQGHKLWHEEVLQRMSNAILVMPSSQQTAASPGISATQWRRNMELLSPQQ